MIKNSNSSFSLFGSISGWLIVLNVISFAYAALVSGTFNSLSMKFAQVGGAADTALILSGEWWRLFTGIFFHFGFLHLWFNCMALKVLGPRIESIIGPVFFIVIYLISGVVSTLASSMTHLSVGGGASGAIFGVIGIGVVLDILIPRQITQNDSLF